MLRHGRLVRLRGGALRTLHEHRRAPALPRGPGRGGGDDHRGDRRFLPTADSARNRPPGPASAGDHPGRTAGSVPDAVVLSYDKHLWSQCTWAGYLRACVAMLITKIAQVGPR